MRITTLKIFLRLSTILATATLVFSYAFGGWSVALAAIAGIGAVWLIGQQRGWPWVAPLGLIGFLGAAAFGIWQKLPPAWMIFAAVLTLMAWDLSLFSQRLHAAGRIVDESDLIRAHVRRVLIVAVLGLVLSEAVLGVKIEFSFASALMLGLLAVLGLSRAVGFLRRESD